jgi:hypothetical protein
MAQSVDRIRIKTKRAKEHIIDLESEIKSFFDTKPYVIGTKRNPQTRQLIYYLVSVLDVPERIAAITGDILQNLRSALDHLAYALFMVGPRGASGSPASHIYFPIYDDAVEYATKSVGKIRGMRQDAIDAINAVKPYKGGNDTIWLLHRLNNIDKHRFVILVGSAFRSMDLGAIAFWDMAEFDPALADMDPIHAFFGPTDRQFPLKVGDELFIDAPDAKVKEKLQFCFDIAFGEPGIIEGAPLIETLHGMADLVDHLLTDFALLLA